MFGIVIATDGKFAEGLKDASEVIFGPSKQLEAMGLHLGDNVETFGQTIQKAVLSVNQGKGILVLVDVKGASPYNQSLLAQHQLQDQIEGGVSYDFGCEFADAFGSFKSTIDWY